ncbi:NlpC/P60 family protein [uncultured Mitsuokella sp.]|uniref:NlpC/P60 family protein n=1 Tax=uncultured Mitsuokella sp. TaxID=453120 RepID=UPI002631EFC1|nr:NlpC/P60 family protein [uncultured Mitsuokella sp.]
MRIRAEKILLAFFLLAFCWQLSSADASPEITDERATPAYWVSRHPEGERVLLDEAGVKNVNAALRQHNETLVDLAAMPETITGNEIERRIEAVQALGDFDTASVPGLYKNGAALTAYSYGFARKNCNLASLPQEEYLRYGIVTERANLRLLPEAAGWFESAGDTHYDTLQATALDPAEPVAILADSHDGKFFFVASRYYDGWLAKSSLGLTDRDTWLGYVQPADFAVVTANKKRIAAPGGRSLLFQMGAKIPVRSAESGRLQLRLPGAEAGKLREELVTLPADDTLHHGFLPCTENNFIRQGFRFLGDVYGWGGLDDSVDCSAFVADVYRSMGVEIPRDANQQAKSMPDVTDLSGMSEEERLAALSRCRPGTLLANNTHVMMYLGEDADGTPIVLQSMSSWFSFGSDYGKHYLRKVIASTATFLNASGNPYIDGVHYLGSL